MARISIPRPPYTPATSTLLIQEGINVTHIWVLKEAGLATIETLYATSSQIMKRLGCSRATAYRIIKRHKHRYWMCDLRPDTRESCLSVLPLEVLEHIQLLPLGNPHFRDGVYQQDIARRRRRLSRRSRTY